MISEGFCDTVLFCDTVVMILKNLHCITEINYILKYINSYYFSIVFNKITVFFPYFGSNKYSIDKAQTYTVYTVYTHNRSWHFLSN